MLNGLIYQHPNLCKALLANKEHVETMFSLFEYQFPIELHEDALYICLNLVTGATKQMKQELVESGVVIPLCTFMSDLAELEFE